MSNQIVISSGAKVRELEGVLTGTAGIVNALGINVPSGIPQLDGSGKILVSQLPNSVMEYKGTWNAATNTPTLADGTGNQGDVYLCNVAGTVNFGSGPIAFFVGDQVIYSGTIWQRASGATGTVTSVAVTESGDALSITGSPITTSGTINIGFTGTSGQYVNGAGGLTTFPTDNITGSGLSGQVTYFNGVNTITGENAFNYDASTNRLGVNTTVPNATIGANAGTDSGYSLLVKNDNANYNGIGFATTSTYGNVIGTEKLGTAPARNLTLLNQSGYISLTEVGNLGVGILTPNTGIDIYNGTTSSLWLHTANSGVTGTDGVRLALFSNNGAVLRNNEGTLSMSSEGDFYVITLGAENIRVNSVDGKVGIGNPATVAEMLTVNGSIQQSGVLSSLLKTNGDGKLIAAVAGTDYVAPSGLSSYVPYTGATANVNLGTFDLTADVITGATGSFASSGGSDTFAINHSSGSGIALNITKGGNGEGLYINKTSGSGNAATIIGTLNATTIVKSGGTSSQYLMADGSVTTSAGFITGSGVDGRVPYFNGTSSITSEAGFIYDSSTNRLGVNTSVPNATIGADAALNSGYGLLIKTGASDYNGIGIAFDSTYGNTIEAARLGSAPSRNLTLLNVSGYVSLTEAGNFGVGILSPNTGIDIYHSTISSLWLHTATSGITGTDGVRLFLSSNSNAVLRNNEGSLSMSSESDFYVITLGAENIRVNSANGYVGIGNPTTLTSILTVNGAITQTSVTSALLKTDASGTLVAAVAGTDYVTPSGLSGYVPTSRTLTINGTTYDLSANRSWTISSGVSGTTDYIPRFTSSTTIGNSDISQDATFVTLNSKALSAPRARFNTAYDNASLSVNIFGQTYMDSRTSRLYQTFNLSSISNYMHIYDPYSTVNANGGFSIGASSSITLLPSTSIIHFDGVNNRVGIGTTSPSAALSVVGAATFSSSLGANGIMSLGDDGTFGSTYKTLGLTGNTNGSHRIFAGTADNMYLAAATSRGIYLCTNGNVTPRLTVDTNGNVGIGTTSPNKQSFTNALTINSASTNVGLELSLADAAGFDIFYNSSLDVFLTNRTNGAMAFRTNATERMRITSGGSVFINTTSALPGSGTLLHVDSPAAGPTFRNGASGQQSLMLWNAVSSGDNLLVEFNVNTSISGKGSIDYNRAVNIIRYNTTSDANLKNIIGDSNLEKSINILNSTKIREYSWKDDVNNKPQIGVIAQELYQTYKGAVSVGSDESLLGTEDYKSWKVDKTAFTFHLIAGWQKHEQKINDLQAQIEELKALIAAK